MEVKVKREKEIEITLDHLEETLSYDVVKVLKELIENYSGKDIILKSKEFEVCQDKIKIPFPNLYLSKDHKVKICGYLSIDINIGHDFKKLDNITFNISTLKNSFKGITYNLKITLSGKIKVVKKMIIFQVLKKGQRLCTFKGNIFIECETDKGTIALWGRRSNLRNIEKIEKARIPFKLISNLYVEPNEKFPHHRYWIPEVANIEINPL